MGKFKYKNQSRINNDEKTFINMFIFNYSKYKDRKIALYGIGEKTKLILENVKGFNFVGLMDKDTIGSNVYGLKVLSYDEVISNANLIIIVANMSVVELIYNRISFLRKLHGIEIKYINGTTPNEINENISKDPYWLTNIDKLKYEIDKHDVISFDIFDTLLMRKVLNPSNIFDLVEKELNKKYKINIPFKIKRIEAEKYCYNHLDRYYDINQIYTVLKPLLNISEDDFMQRIMEIEFFFEEKCCIQRKVIIDSYFYAINKGKIICLTSDMHINRKKLELLLSKNNITKFDKLLISCEEKKSKYFGDMFEYLKQLYEDKKILHIGDNKISDEEMPKKYSISTFKIKNSYDLISNSTFKDILTSVKNIDDSILLGEIIAYFLNNPFSLNKEKGSLYIDNMYDIGFLAFGPMTLNYVLWLIRMANENNIEKLLFFARDGYILEKIYRKVVEHFNIDAPESIYFLTSRRASSVASIKKHEDISFIIKNMCKTKNIKIRELIYTAFGIFTKNEDSFAEKYYYEITEKDLIEHILCNYKDLIFANSLNERKNYLHYIKSLSLENCSNIGCVNFVGRGITQYSISKIMQKDLYGYYFATEYDITNIVPQSQKVYGLYGELISPHIDKTSIATKYLFGEIIFTSPNEQFIKFDDNIQPIFENKQSNKRKFSMIKMCHNGILAFVEEIIKSDEYILERDFNSELIDKLYGLFTSKACILSDTIKKNFIFNDYYNPVAQDVNLFTD